MENAAWIWGVVIIGGPILLFVALMFAKLRNAPKTRRDDPDTPSDDPSKGMTGHDRPPEG